MPDSHDDLDSAIRQHLAQHLNAQRGKASAAFDQHITKPMQNAIGQQMDSLQLHLSLPRRALNYCAHHRLLITATGLSMLLGITLAIDFNLRQTPVISADADDVIQPLVISTRPETDSASPHNINVSTIYRHIDEGPVMLDLAKPGRRICQQRLDRMSWDDSNDHTHVEFVIPIESRLYVEAPIQ